MPNVPNKMDYVLIVGTPGSLDDALYSLRRFEEWGVPDVSTLYVKCAHT